MSGALHLSTADFSPSDLGLFRRQLTLKTAGFKKQPGQLVQVYEETQRWLQVPRHFNSGYHWPRVTRWDWVVPTLQTPFAAQMTLDPVKRQPEAVSSMVAHLRKNSGGVLVAPTGVGKTLLGLEIARQFNTPVGVLIYAAHMVENWLEHIEKHYGLPRAEVGMVRQGQCDVGPITLISVQSILSQRYPDEFYRSFGFIIADEVNRYGAAVWHKTLAEFPARFRLGMSADPDRKDGLGPVIGWCFGEVGFSLQKREIGAKAAVCMIEYQGATYKEAAYCDVHRENNQLVIGEPNDQKYDRCLMHDKQRNAWLVAKIVEARKKGRSILTFSKRREHCQALLAAFNEQWMNARANDPSFPSTLPDTRAALLLGGATNKKQVAEQKEALTADVIFSTYGYARDAMNATQLDTLVFATPPGNPLQPIGRLREVTVAGKKSLLVLDTWETNPYAQERSKARRALYRRLGHQVADYKAKP